MMKLKLEQLESRLCPTGGTLLTLNYWVADGLDGHSWGTAENWSLGHAPAANGEIAVFDGAWSNQRCDYGGQGRMADELLFQNGYGGKLYINSPDNSQLSADILTMSAPSDVVFVNDNLVLTLGGLEMHRGAVGQLGERGSVHVIDELRLVTDDSVSIGANLVLLSDSDSVLENAHTVYLVHGAHVKVIGKVEQRSGLVEATMDGSYVEIYETGEWTKTTAATAELRSIDVVKMSGLNYLVVEGGTLFLNGGSTARLGNLYQTSGHVEVHAGATLKSVGGGLTVYGGVFRTMGAGDAYVVGNVELVNVGLSVAYQGAAGAYGTLHVDGNLFLGGCTEYYCQVAGDGSAGDKIDCTGLFDVEFGTNNDTQLRVDVYGGLTPDADWVIIEDGSPLGSFSFARWWLPPDLSSSFDPYTVVLSS